MNSNEDYRQLKQQVESLQKELLSLRLTLKNELRKELLTQEKRLEKKIETKVALAYDSNISNKNSFAETDNNIAILDEVLDLNCKNAEDKNQGICNDLSEISESFLEEGEKSPNRHTAILRGPENQNSASSILTRGFFARNFFSRKSVEERVSLQPTLHMYTIYTLLHKHWSRAWCMCLFSMLIILIQIIVLQNIIVEAAFPPCSSNIDCSLGQHCGIMDASATPRCNDCPPSLPASFDFVNCSSILLQIPEYDYENLDHKYFLYNKNTDPNDVTAYCLASLHCESTTTNGINTCEHYFLNSNKLTSGFLICFVFFALMGLAPMLNSDIEEAMVEELVLDYYLSQNKKAPIHYLASFAASLIHIILRIRCYVIPFFAAMATASIILGNEFLVQNVLLNILSIIFLTEIDNLATTFILPSSELKQVKNFIREIKSTQNILVLSHVLWFWPRLISVIASLLLFFPILLFQYTARLSGAYCSYFYDQMLEIILITFATFFFFDFLIVAVSKRSWVKVIQTVLWNTLAFTTMHVTILNFGVDGGFAPDVIFYVLMGILGFLFTCLVFVTKVRFFW